MDSIKGVLYSLYAGALIIIVVTMWIPNNDSSISSAVGYFTAGAVIIMLIARQFNVASASTASSFIYPVLSYLTLAGLMLYKGSMKIMYPPSTAAFKQLNYYFFLSELLLLFESVYFIRLYNAAAAAPPSSSIAILNLFSVLNLILAVTCGNVLKYYATDC